MDDVATKADTLISRPVAAFFAVLLVSAVFATTPITTSNSGFDFDGSYYAAMAGSARVPPALARVAPWSYRPLTPALVSLLPWDTLTSFRVTAFVANVLSLVILFLVLQHLGFTSSHALLGLGLYSGVFWTLKFAFFAPAYIDAETQLVLLAIIYFTIRSQYVLLVVLLMAAALQKESLAAFSLFSAAALVREQRGRLSWRSGALVVAMISAPLLVIWAVRAAMPAAIVMRAAVPGVTETSGLVDELVGHLRLLGYRTFWPILLQSIFSGLGLLPAVMAAHPRSWLAFLRTRYEWIVYLIISAALLFAGLDKARLFLYLLPLATICSLLAAESVLARSSTGRALVWLGVLLGLHFFIGGHLTPMGGYDAYLAKMVPEHSDGRYVPYLIRNLALTAGFLALTAVWTRRPKA